MRINITTVKSTYQSSVNVECAAHNNTGGFHCDSTENTVFKQLVKKEFNNLLKRQCE